MANYMNSFNNVSFMEFHAATYQAEFLDIG